MRAGPRRAGVLGALLLVVVTAGAGCGGDDDTPAASSTASTPSTVASTTATTAVVDTLRILVTNDDGVGGEGIAVLVAGLETIDDVEVVVVAPEEDRTGTGGSTTEGPLRTTDTELVDGHRATAVDGFPADTIRAALDDLGVEPDVVVSGINAGQNLGPLVDLSGTVGAARAAAARGIPALAVSQGIGSAFDYDAAVTFVLDWLEERRDALLDGSAPDVVANMNVPSCAAGEIRGVIEVDAAPAGAEGSVQPQDCASTATDPATDVDAFNNGYTALTPELRPVA